MRSSCILSVSGGGGEGSGAACMCVWAHGGGSDSSVPEKEKKKKMGEDKTGNNFNSRQLFCARLVNAHSQWAGPFPICISNMCLRGVFTGLCVHVSEPGHPRGGPWTGSRAWALMWHGDNEALSPPLGQRRGYHLKWTADAGGGRRITWRRSPHPSATPRGDNFLPSDIANNIAAGERAGFLSANDNRRHFRGTAFVLLLFMSDCNGLISFWKTWAWRRLMP